MNKILLQNMRQNGGNYIKEHKPQRVNENLYTRWVYNYARHYSIMAAVSGFGATYLVSAIVLKIGYGIPVSQMNGARIFITALMVGIVFGGAIGLVVLRLKMNEFDLWLDDLHKRPTVERMEFNAPPAPTLTAATANIVTPTMGTAVIDQPTPAAFREWLAAVVGDGRVQFSQRQSAARGFSTEQFCQLLAELLRVGWLDKTPDNNGVFRMTDAGKDQAREWLEE